MGSRVGMAAEPSHGLPLIIEMPTSRGLFSMMV
jgi:hypothetical protein